MEISAAFKVCRPGMLPTDVQVTSASWLWLRGSGCGCGRGASACVSRGGCALRGAEHRRRRPPPSSLPPLSVSTLQSGVCAFVASGVTRSPSYAVTRVSCVLQLPSTVQRRVDDVHAAKRGSAQQSPAAMPWQSQANVSNVTYAPSHVAAIVAPSHSSVEYPRASSCRDAVAVHLLVQPVDTRT